MILNGLKSLRERHRHNQLVRRKGPPKHHQKDPEALKARQG